MRMPVPLQIGPLDPADRDGVRALAAAAREADGVAPLSEQPLLRLADDEPWLTHVTVRTKAGAVVGYAQVDRGGADASAELVVHPDHRRGGVGSLLLRTCERDARLPQFSGTPGQRGKDLRVWAHGDTEAARAFAAAAGYVVVRELLILTKPLAPPHASPQPATPPSLQPATPPVPQPTTPSVILRREASAGSPGLDTTSGAEILRVAALPQDDGRGAPPQDDGRRTPPQDDGSGTSPQDDGRGTPPQDDRRGAPPQDDRRGYRLRPFVPGGDDDAWVALNARAFAGHPEQGRLTAADLRARMAEPWFDPAGFFVAEAPDGALVGFHWTKVHADDGGTAPRGEVYALGVDPDHRGRGLGRALLDAGLAHLATRARTAVLYVDGDNAAALAVYEAAGFVRAAIDVQYGRPAGARISA